MHDIILINCDGGSRGNPGPAACGVVIWDDKHNKIESFGERIGVATNNVAEYQGLIRALKLAAKHTKKTVRIFMDSELVLCQVTGKYSVKKAHLKLLCEEVKKLAAVFETVEYKHVPREDKYQVEADRMVNDALEGA